MAEKWTPGPWVQFIYDGLLSILPAGRPGEVAQVWVEDGLPNAEANARLIAAAPELYAALSDLVYAIACNELMPESVSYLREARAALAKARGE